MNSSTSSPRQRFRPEPVETTVRHSDAKSRAQELEREALKAAARNSHTLDGKAATHTSKKFKVEPIEISQRSNRNAVMHNGYSADDETPLLPHERSVNKPSSSHSPSRRKFAVEPMETTSRSYHHDQGSTPASSSSAASSTTTDTSNTPKPPPARRKFKVEMIETAKRSRRSGDSAPAVRAEDKTNGTHSESFKVPSKARTVDPSDSSTLRPPPTPVVPSNTPTTSSANVPIAELLKPSPNRQGSMHPHYTTRANTRTHSFKVPDLEAISSSESSPMASSVVASSRRDSVNSADEPYKDATRMRESVDDRFSGYLLALAARAAEKQLRDQEAAVFSAADAHDPIAHYIDESGSDESPVVSRTATQAKAPGKYRRDSDDERAALSAMRAHGEARHRSQSPARRKTGAFNVEFDAEAAQDAWMANSGVNATHASNERSREPLPNAGTAGRNDVIGGTQRDPDLKQMRKAASPPMLGGDMEFPRCPSPERARFDVTQGPEFLRMSMYGDGGKGLWGQEAKPHPSPQPSPQPGKEEKNDGGGKAGGCTGLWGGHCTASSNLPTSIPHGIVTPRRTPSTEPSDPFQSLNIAVTTPASAAGARHPPSPPPSNTSVTSLGGTKSTKQAREDAILAKEFPDTFVTQVYNYLSLGFPALARKFDDELCKISGVCVDELRQDDKLAEQRGYLRLGEDEVDVLKPEGSDGDEMAPVQGEECARWRALRIYVREWGRQMGVCEEGGERRRVDPVKTWGVPVRKGSWAG